MKELIEDFLKNARMSGYKCEHIECKKGYISISMDKDYKNFDFILVTINNDDDKTRQSGIMLMKDILGLQINSSKDADGKPWIHISNFKHFEKKQILYTSLKDALAAMPIKKEEVEKPVEKVPNFSSIF